jgi:two-component system chemotaxis response regulator CheB
MMATNRNAAIRAVIVDDSSTMRELLASVLKNAEGIEVVGLGANGEEGVRLTQRLRPDIITLDMRMPGMNGLEATRQIMRDLPTPIVIISGSLMPDDIHMTFEALKAGALAVVSKPGLADPEACDRVVQTVRQMAGVSVIHYWNPAGAAATEWNEKTVPFSLPPMPFASQIIGICASTGGPPALAALLTPLPADYPLPIIVLQRLHPGFTLGMMDWLRKQTTLHIEIATHGDALRPGTVFLAPDDYHIQVTRQGIIELSKTPPDHGWRPSANYLFRSLAQTYGSGALAVVLSGLGDDGLAGLEAVSLMGGLILVQEESSCIAAEAPRAVLSHGLTSHALPLDQLTAILKQLHRKNEPDSHPTPIVPLEIPPAPPKAEPVVIPTPPPAAARPTGPALVEPSPPPAPLPRLAPLLPPIEARTPDPQPEPLAPPAEDSDHSRTIQIRTDVDVIAARTYVRDLARVMGMHLRDQARISLAASSLAYGLKLGGTHQGRITVGSIHNGPRTGIQVICIREGPPCTLEPGALGDTKWMVDELTVNEQPPNNLEVTAIKWLT